MDLLALLQDLIGCQSSLHLKNTLKSQSAAAGRDAAVPGEFAGLSWRQKLRFRQRFDLTVQPHR